MYSQPQKAMAGNLNNKKSKWKRISWEYLVGGFKDTFKMSPEPLPEKMIQFDEHIYVERGGSFYQLAQMLHVENIFLHLP